MFTPKKASRQKRPLKVAIEGLAGSGKTFTALRLAFDLLAHNIGSRLLVIDTENESASLYADVECDDRRWEFDTVALGREHHTPTGFTEAYHWTVREGYDIIIMYSLSHAWHGALEQVDPIASGLSLPALWSYFCSPPGTITHIDDNAILRGRHVDKFPRFYRNENEFLIIAEKPKLTACPLCNEIGTLNRHGQLYGYDDQKLERFFRRVRDQFLIQKLDLLRTLGYSFPVAVVRLERWLNEFLFKRPRRMTTNPK
jgi:hypothetical protein